MDKEKVWVRSMVAMLNGYHSNDDVAMDYCAGIADRVVDRWEKRFCESKCGVPGTIKVGDLYMITVVENDIAYRRECRVLDIVNDVCILGDIAGNEYSRHMSFLLEGRNLRCEERGSSNGSL